MYYAIDSAINLYFYSKFDMGASHAENRDSLHFYCFEIKLTKEIIKLTLGFVHELSHKDYGLHLPVSRKVLERIDLMPTLHSNKNTLPG